MSKAPLSLCRPGKKGISEQALNIIWNDNDYAMKAHPTLNKRIPEVWDEKANHCALLFDASKFRLHSTVQDKEHPLNVTLLLGKTSYKDFIGTNCAPYAEELVKEGTEMYENPQIFMADPMGVGSLLETADGKLVFIRRSNICAEMPGLIDRPGGHPEPDEVSNMLGKDQMDPLLIKQEIYSSVLKEIRDEVNIPIENLSPPVLLGIGYNETTNNRPSLEFYVRCDLSGDAVQNLYSKQTQAESNESTELILLSIETVLEMGKLKKGKMWDDLTTTLKSAIFFFQIFLTEKDSNC